MKKAINISLAQTLFNLEEDAYLKLDEYLKSIRAHFVHTPEREEIMQDIETRLAELFLEKKKKVIALKEVEMVIASMGTVADFEADDKMETVYTPSPKKKLYRNPEDKVIAGVCSGLAAYFNVKVIWVRLLFVFFILVTSGVGLLVYLLMVLLISEAKTTAQKLEMEGEPVTLETMTENVKEKAKQVTKNASSRLTKVLSWPFMVIKKIFELLVHYLVPFLRVLLGLFVAFLSISGLIFASVAASMLLAGNEAYFGFSLVKVLSAPLLYLTVVAFYLLAFIPLLVILILSLSLIRKKNLLHFKLGLTLLLLWIVTLVGAGVGGFNVAPKLQAYVQNSPVYRSTTQEIPLNIDQIKTLEVSDHISLNLIQGDTLKLTANGTLKSLSSLKLKQENDILNLSTKKHSDFDNFCLFCPSNQIELTLVAPSLDSIQAYNGGVVNGQGWQVSKNPINLELSNGSMVSLNVKAPEISAQVESNGNLILYTEADLVNLKALQGASINLSGDIKKANLQSEFSAGIKANLAKIQEVKAQASQGGTIELGKIKKLDAEATFGANINYQGQTELIKKEKMGGVVESVRSIEEYNNQDPEEVDFTENVAEKISESADEGEIENIDSNAPETPALETSSNTITP